MAGGYVAVVVVNRLGVPFYPALPLTFLFPRVLAAVIERTIYRPVYARSHPDQVLFTVGLLFIVVGNLCGRMPLLSRSGAASSVSSKLATSE